MSKTSERPRILSIVFRPFDNGVFLALLAGFLFTTQDMAVQLVLLKGMDVPSLGVYQGILGAVYAFWELIRNKEENIILGTPGYRILLWTRAAAVTGSSIFFFSSVRYLPLSIAVLVFQFRPLLMSYACRVVLGETMNIQQVLASLCMLVGEFLVAQPPPFFHSTAKDGTIGATASERLLGVFFVLMCIACSSYDIIVTRMLSSHVSNEMMLGTFCLGDLVICFCWLLVELEPLKVPHSWLGALLVFIVASTQIAGRLASSSALRRVSALTAALVAQTQVLFSIVEEFITLGTHINLTGGGGALVILASGTWAILARPEEQGTSKADEAISATDQTAEENEAAVPLMGPEDV